MSSHATAILAYGVLLDESLVMKLSAEKGYFEIEDLLVHSSGLVEPSKKDKESYAEYKKRLEDLEDNCPAEICNVGDHETQIYALVIKKRIFRAEERYPKNIEAKKLQIESTKLTEFESFCKELKIKGNPNWILMSRYD